MVRLKVKAASFDYANIIDFNSNMVRLKAIEQVERMDTLIFQFQYGSIKRT